MVFSGLMSCEMGLGTSVCGGGLGVVAGDEGVVGGGVELVDEAGFVGSFGVLGLDDGLDDGPLLESTSFW